MKAIGRMSVAVVIAVSALFANSGTSHAGLDNEMALLDEQAAR